MKKGIYFFSLLTFVLLGCDREEPLPALGVEGVYLMGQVVDVNGIELGEDQVGSNVYWLFEDRTFRKAQLKNEALIEATGTFREIEFLAEGDSHRRQFELIYLTGNEIIEGCHEDMEILIQTRATQLVNEGHPCGEFNYYYDKTILN